MKDLLLQKTDAAFFARAMALEQACFELPHPAGDFGDGLVNRCIDVFRCAFHFDDDVIGAEEDDFSDLAIVLHIEDDLGLNDARIIEMQTLDLFMRVIANGFSDFNMSSSDDDWQVNVVFLHGVCPPRFRVIGWGKGLGYMVKSSPKYKRRASGSLTRTSFDPWRLTWPS